MSEKENIKRQKNFEELNETELIIVKEDYEKWKKDHKEELYQREDLWPFKEESYYKRFKERFNFLIEEKEEEIKMEKIRLKDINLSEEIIQNKVIGEKLDKVMESSSGNFKFFISEVPYREFKIILVNSQPPKDSENYYYKLSKYGWWTFCAKKDGLDDMDKELLKALKRYSLYKEEDHSFCFDNMVEEGDEAYSKDYFPDGAYNLHPNEMVEIVKKSIDKFHKDKEELTKSAGRKQKK